MSSTKRRLALLFIPMLSIPVWAQAEPAAFTLRMNTDPSRLHVFEPLAISYVLGYQGAEEVLAELSPPLDGPARQVVLAVEGPSAAGLAPVEPDPTPTSTPHGARSMPPIIRLQPGASVVVYVSELYDDRLQTYRFTQPGTHHVRVQAAFPLYQRQEATGRWHPLGIVRISSESQIVEVLPQPDGEAAALALWRGKPQALFYESGGDYPDGEARLIELSSRYPNSRYAVHANRALQAHRRLVYPGDPRLDVSLQEERPDGATLGYLATRISQLTGVQIEVEAQMSLAKLLPVVPTETARDIMRGWAADPLWWATTPKGYRLIRASVPLRAIVQTLPPGATVEPFEPRE